MALQQTATYVSYEQARDTFQNVSCNCFCYILSREHCTQYEVLGSTHLFSELPSPKQKKVPDSTQEVTDLDFVELPHGDF